MRQKWTEEEIWSWYKAQPWITGFNFIPSGAMNGGIWLLQDYDHERAYRESAKEIALAASLGFNSIRFFVPFFTSTGALRGCPPSIPHIEVIPMSLINVSNLTFAYEGSYDNVFENVSFQLDTDWRLGLVGRNGRGKTTLLNLLQGKYEYAGAISASLSKGRRTY